MKIRNLIIVLGVAAALGGLWFGRLAWRAHKNLVTLHARNMPIAEVVRSLERQTWEKIRYDKKLGAKITLNVKDAPLDVVLDAVAERAGARWQKTFAVGASDNAMAKLESVLAGDQNLDAAGWTNIAPRFVDLPLESVLGGGEKLNAAGQTNIAPQFVGMPVENLPAQLPEHLRGKPGAIGRKQFLVRSTGDDGKAGGDSISAMTVTSLPDGTVDQWSSERLVLETSLLPGISAALPLEASLQTARQIASAVHGRPCLFYALEKSPYEVNMPPAPPAGKVKRPGRPPGANVADIGASLTQERLLHRLRELGRSPEEQVERARQNTSGQMRIESVKEP